MNLAQHIERLYSGLSRQDLQRHIQFCGRVLAADSSVQVVLSNGGRIPIWMRKTKTKPVRLEVQISAGHLGRSVVEKVAEHLESGGVEFKRRFTQKRKELSRITTAHEVGDAFRSRAVTDIISSVSQVAGADSDVFSVEYVSRFEEGCVVEDGDPVVFGPAYRLGHALGHTAGAVARLFRP